MMKKLFFLFLILLMLTSCAPQIPPQDTTESQPPVEDSTDDPITEDDQTPEDVTPEHSPLYVEGVSPDDAFRFFNEVSLDAEFTAGDSASLVQKWVNPVLYRVMGTPTEADMQALEDFARQVSLVQGFPGMREAAENEIPNLTIHFCTAEELVSIMGDQFSTWDFGACTFWYDGNNVIYEGTICCRNDIEQSERSSVIAEELYNILGPVQDTVLREDSLIYQYSNTALHMTAEDLLVLQLLYHDSIRPGMTAEECETVIREIYY